MWTVYCVPINTHLAGLSTVMNDKEIAEYGGRSKYSILTQNTFLATENGSTICPD